MPKSKRVTTLSLLPACSKRSSKTGIAFLLLLCLLVPTQNGLEAQSIRINAVVPPEGKTFVHITGIAQDKQGYMWFGSKKGLYRYDGYNFISYKNDPLNLNSLASNSLESLAIDSTSTVWIGTFGSGLDRFDPVAEKFTHFRHDSANEASLSSDTILAILPDSKGIFWIGTPSGLDRFDPATNKSTHYRHDANDPLSLSCNEVRTIYEDRQGTLWVGTGSPYPDDKSGADDGGLNKMDAKTGKFTRYMRHAGDPHSLINNKVGAILEDSKGNFWVGTAGDGLHTMDRETGSFERYEYDAASPEKLSRPPLNKAYPWDHISFIKEDASGAIWIGTSDAGMNRYDTRTKKIRHYESSQKSEWLGGTFDDQTSWAAFSSRDGIFWISTITGHLLRIDPFDRNLPFISVANKVTTLYEEPAGLVWIGGENQLILRDDKSGKETTPYPGTWYTKIFEDRQDNIWIGTADGLYMTDKKRQQITSYMHDDKDIKSISDNVVLAIYEDDRSDMWIGTIRGLDRLNKSDRTFVHYKVFPNDDRRFGDNIITSICVDNQGKLWVGSPGAGGLHQLNKTNGSFKNYLYGTEIRSIYNDSGGTVWVAANDGLYLYNASSDVFTRFSDPSSPRGVDNVRSIIEDNDRNLWIATDDGIIKLNAQRNETTLFGKNYNVEGLTNGSAYKNKDGKLYFGTSAGYYFFDPRQLKSGSKFPQVILSAFRIADKLVKPGNNSPIATSLFTASEIRLPYNQNVFSIDFIAIDYTNPQDNRYLFMLENYDNTWRQAGSDRRASFYNVPPGKYIFKVKAANSDGLWAERDLTIIITPPWWRTWWAYCIYGLLFILAAYGFYRFQREKVIRAERERSRTKELAQAREIERAYNELKTTQAQLVQAEKMASLGELTAGIAHEIQNPLNFVNNFSEVNRELIEELKSHLASGETKLKSEAQEEILKDIDQNLEKISLHGKRADAIVKGMLQHSRMSSGQKESTDINTLVDEYLRLAYHGLRAKDKAFNAKFETDLDPLVGKINIVPQDVGRVILNLINNAFYAAPLPPNRGFRDPNYKHEPTVWVSTKKEGNKVLISVRDNGPGIPANI
ncbi:MAG TPA: two-component regulator propeller domain-containing protein, partial [Chitinophagaceae bacterium]|nr:two-component regulator propeller domain-containing protein [Chitinophagaceae bacterium]